MADSRAAETSSSAPVLWDGPEARAALFSGFSSLKTAISSIKTKTNDKATLSFVLLLRQAVRFGAK
ncbi:hypothetical protein EJ074_00495 [Mesorhizobium sp. M3A.F.Ca.ET.080.04.2.1]|uniref:hypothetical protein n=1 Tax=Mesorhizobium sp. M3A.F.Ca.ET.080.04.2.1 TaxID=2493676 RepID=UPI000F7532AC|nr:hypothetical protein [Mesorhizobium sp. M3A.F.Ca.ET.080.04.2.1]AZO07771.1 hypothetical protein EJ074_00495 [Mesorhizobium sp. M3A.F.Ca.ET.080.04.2.1]